MKIEVCTNLEWWREYSSSADLFCGEDYFDDGIMWDVVDAICWALEELGHCISDSSYGCHRWHGLKPPWKHGGIASWDDCSYPEWENIGEFYDSAVESFDGQRPVEEPFE